MRERVARLLGSEPSGMWAGTFHAIGARMLRRDATLVGRTPRFTIYDEDDALSAIRRLMDRLRISTKQWTPKAVRAAVSDAKNALVLPPEYESLAMDPFSRVVASVYRQLDDALREANAADFDDLLLLPVRLLRENPSVLESYRSRFQFVLVDEYQDTNRAQYELIRLVAGQSGNVCVVGDDDQSIYGWRGADIRNILDFEKDFPNTTVVRLEENYRSTPEVLALANTVISVNTSRRGKTLRATHRSGDRVTVIGAADDRDEAEAVVDEIEARRAAVRSLSYRDFAILYRTNAQSRSLEEALRRRDVPYRLIGAVKFYDRREIRDLLSYLKLVANPADDEAFLRAISVPKRGLGDTTIERLAAIAREARVPMLVAAGRPDLVGQLRLAARQPLLDFAHLVEHLRHRAADAGADELLKELVTAVHYEEYLRAEGPESEERLENVEALIDGAAQAVSEEGGEVGLTPLDNFLQRTALVADIDSHDPATDAVTLMTVHNAKGLEFPIVFITGLEDGLFPISRAFDDPAMLEEERRLFYVGITRAERTLYLSHARNRRRNGQLMESIPSSFLRPIQPESVEQRPTIRLRASGRSVLPGVTPHARRPGQPVSYGTPARTRDADVEASQDAPRFTPAERVRHKLFGSGVIVEVTGVGKDVKVTIDFEDESVGRKQIKPAYTTLERGWE
jgi:DNA helicase-2/ATP-dependent DNA helicase PcrA